MGCGSSSETGQPQPQSKASTQDEKLRKAVNTVFEKYDKDKSGLLDKEEVFIVINAALNQMQSGRQASKEEVQRLITKSDANKDGKISKEQLFKLFKTVAQG